jgi:carbon-monoxide dehydrogenase small subunit
MLAAQADGHEIVTIEGLGDDVLLHPLQEAALDAGGVQCGYCTPGMLLAAADLLARIPEPSDAEVRDAIGMNLCRCTGYVKQIDGIHAAASGEVSR